MTQQSEKYRQCWGLNRNLQRCKRKGCWRLFCHDHRRQPLIWCAFFIFTVLGGTASILSLLSLIGEEGEQDKEFARLEVTDKQLNAFSKEKFGILIASFRGEHNEIKGQKLRSSITHTLNARFREFNIYNAEAKDIPFDISNGLRSHQEARSIGKKYNAEIVIWGDITFKGVIPNLTIVNQFSTTSFLTGSNITLFKESLTHNAISLDEIRLPAFTDEPTLIILFVTALKYYKEEQFKIALHYLKKSISSNTTSHINYYPIFLYMGNSSSSMREFDDAIYYFNKAIKIDPKLPTAYNNRGIVYCFMKYYNIAINDFRKALQVNTKSSITSIINLNLRNAYINHGNQFIVEGENEKAIMLFDKAIEIDSNNAKAYINRGTAYSFNEEYDKAIADFREAIKIDSNSSLSFSSLGSTYADMGYYTKAILAYNKAIKINPKDPTFYFNKAHTYKELDRKKDAIDAYRKFIQCASHEPQFKPFIEEAKRYIKTAGQTH